jgi:hypothetical protein
MDSERNLAEKIKSIPKDLDILIAHGPPMAERRFLVSGAPGGQGREPSRQRRFGASGPEPSWLPDPSPTMDGTWRIDVDFVPGLGRQVRLRAARRHGKG